jgi:hypothetical protein
VERGKKRSEIISRLESLRMHSDGKIDRTFKISHTSHRPNDEGWIRGFASIFLCMCMPWNVIAEIGAICHDNGVQFIIAVTFGP